jgi:hypothetical protein
MNSNRFKIPKKNSKLKKVSYSSLSLGQIFVSSVNQPAGPGLPRGLPTPTFGPWLAELLPAPGLHQPRLGRLNPTGLASTEMEFFMENYPLFYLIVSFSVLICL